MWMTVLIAVVALVALAAASVAVTVYRRPLATYGWSQRRALGRTGLVRTEVTTAVGRQVVWVGGRGPVVVLLHGAGDQAATWAAVIPDLLDQHRLIVPDLAGHGDSEPKQGPLPFDVILRGLDATLDAVAGTDRCVIVGNSLGAWLAMVLAARRPDRIARLVLVNGGAIPGDRTDITFTPTTRAEARRTLEALMGAPATKAPDFVLDDLIRVCRFGPLGRFAGTADSMKDFVLEGRLDEVNVPVDLLWGVDDQVFPLTYAQRLLEGLRAARLTPIERAGHVPHRTSPNRFVAALQRVLALPAPEMRRADR